MVTIGRVHKNNNISADVVSMQETEQLDKPLSPLSTKNLHQHNTIASYEKDEHGIFWKSCKSYN